MLLIVKDKERNRKDKERKIFFRLTAKKRSTTKNEKMMPQKKNLVSRSC
jgi:hypothetical protein